MTPQQYFAAHQERIESHARRVEWEEVKSVPVYVECIEKPEWGRMTATEAGRRIGDSAAEIMAAVQSRGTRRYLHWCIAGQRQQFRARIGNYKSCMQRVRCVETGVVYQCIQDAANAYGLSSRGGINEAVRLKRRAGGVHWEKVGAAPVCVLKQRARQRAALEVAA